MSKTEVNTKMMINLKEAAESLGISKMALRIRVSKGKFRSLIIAWVPSCFGMRIH